MNTINECKLPETLNHLLTPGWCQGRGERTMANRLIGRATC